MPNEGEGGARIEELRRRNRISPTTYYRWRRKYDGLEVDEARWLKQLEEDNHRLKRIVASQAVILKVLKDLQGRSW